MSQPVSTSRSKRAVPLSLRLSDEERARLERDASGQSLSSYIKQRLFGEALCSSRRQQYAPVQDRKLLAQTLAMLGQSRLSQNLNQIAKLAHLGALPVDEELEKELQSACMQISQMRGALMSALNMQER